MVLLKHFLRKGPNKGLVDKKGRNLIHHVVQPRSFASFENVSMLNLLAKSYNCNVKDNQNLTPLDLAYMQDSGTMREALEKLGVMEDEDEQEGRFTLTRAPTSIIAGVSWPSVEINYKMDADTFIEEAKC